MSNFIPSKGDFFYVSLNPYQRVIGGGFGDVAEKVVMQQDRSYSGYVYVCIGRDDHAVVCDRKTNGEFQQTFVIDQVTFSPVGPEVLHALGLVDKEAA